jgi:CheY-like chemotaxis protein
VTPLRLVIVEDEFIVAYELQEMLTQMGHRVCDVVGSGERALEACEADRPDCVLMDVNIRGASDGVQVAAAIQERFGAAVVFLTGFQVADVGERAGSVRPAAVLGKPIDRDELRAVLDRLAATRRAAAVAVTSSGDRRGDPRNR